MLDVHPPHEAAHTWKDFFIHIATICVGLLIAIGLEQSVEAVHHHHQREQLRTSVEKDTRSTLRYADAASQEYTRRLAWSKVRIKQVRQALISRAPIDNAAPFVAEPVIVPADPSFETAKTSGILPLLSQGEIDAYSEVDRLIERTMPALTALVDAHRKRVNFELRYASLTDSRAEDYSRATPADIATYLDLLLDEQSELISMRFRTAYIRGAEAAILDGERDHDRLVVRELQTAKDLPRL